MIELLQSLDQAVLLWIHQAWRCSVGDHFFVWLTTSRNFVIPLAIVWLYLIVRGGRQGRLLALMLALTLLVTDQFVNQVLKPLVGRTRPCFVVDGVVALVNQVRSHSFPSSHAANSFGAATLFYLHRRGWSIFAFPVAILVGLSRIYVGVHYPSDVLAGTLLGAISAWGVWRLVQSAGGVLARRSRRSGR